MICLTSCFCSLLNIGAISFNRYIHICNNFWYKRVFTMRNSLLMCLALWVACILFALPNFFGWGAHIYDRKTLSCIWDRTADLSFSVFIFGGVTFPILLISICYLLIFCHVHKSKNKIHAQPGVGSHLQERNTSRKRKNSMRLVRTLFIIFVIFVICWTPYALLLVIDFPDTLPLEAHLFATMFAHTNSSFNCALYGMTNKQFRRGYRRVLHIDRCMRKCCRRGINRKDKFPEGSNLTAITGANGGQRSTQQ